MTLEETKKAGNICNRDEPCENCPLYDDKICIEHLAENAVRHLEELEQRIPRWISVEERLPELDENVLVYAVGKEEEGFGGEHATAICHRYVLRLFPTLLGNEVWSEPWRYFHTDYEITHWMPMPEPPKEE